MRVGVLGLGFMGSTHLQGLAGIAGAEVVAVMDADEKRLSGDLSSIQGNLGISGLAMDFSRVRKYRRTAEILADPDIEAVDICLPTHLHAPVAMEALRAAKHVLVEKPMALDAASAEAVIAEAEKAGRVLMVAQVCRFMAPYEALHALVTGGRLGPVRSAFFRRRTAVPTWGPWEFDKSKSGGGVFDLLIHDVDQALSLFGPPAAVSATGYEDMAGGIDSIVAEFHYGNTGNVTIAGGWHHRGEYPFSMEYTVIGDNGVVEFSSAGRPAAAYWKNGAKEELPSGGGVDPYRAEIEYFLECCREGKPPARCPPRDSAASVRFTKLMVEAREKRGEKVRCS